MKKIVMAILPAPNEPTAAQAESGNYPKRKVRWNGLTISIENEAGSMRRGVDPSGEQWETRMTFPYGYINGSLGVDGDQVDVFLGPNMESPMVYVVHQRKHGDWKNYDEDKCMLGFDSEGDARAAFLSSYSDPRFLGPITEMPVSEFISKVRATKEAATMIKAIPVLFLKSFVAPHSRMHNGKTVLVSGYTNRRTAAVESSSGQFDLFNDAPAPAAKPRKFYVTMIREPGPRQRVARLAGPFDTHEEALGHVDAARKAAEEADPRSAFDSFGTAAIESDNHRAGVLNERLGIGKKASEA